MTKSKLHILKLITYTILESNIIKSDGNWWKIMKNVQCFNILKTTQQSLQWQKIN